MTTHPLPARTVPLRRRRLGALATLGAFVAGSIAMGASTASAAPVAVTDATFEWGISTELQSAPPFGGCSYLSAGPSDGTQAQYVTTDGNVTVVKNGIAPTWATKCEGAATSAINQKVVWSGGTGTVDPDTGATTLAFAGKLSLNFYGGLVPFTIQDPVVTVDAGGVGSVVATLFGYGSSMEDPSVKIPLDPVTGVVVADLSGTDVGATGFTVTPDYAGVEYTAPASATPQNRTTTGWGSWPVSFVQFHEAGTGTGLSSYWYTSGGAADPKKPPTAITVTYSDVGGDPDPEPGDGEQSISVVVPEVVEPGEFVWSIGGDGSVTLSEAVNHGTYLQSTGAIDPITVTDTRAGAPEWSISGQVGDFTGGIDGKYLGWSPNASGGGALPGAVVESGITSGDGLTAPSILAAAPAGHATGTATLGADLDLKLPVETPAGTYTAILTITALS